MTLEVFGAGSVVAGLRSELVGTGLVVFGLRSVLAGRMPGVGTWLVCRVSEVRSG